MPIGTHHGREGDAGGRAVQRGRARRAPSPGRAALHRGRALLTRLSSKFFFKQNMNKYVSVLKKQQGYLMFYDVKKTLIKNIF